MHNIMFLLCFFAYNGYAANLQDLTNRDVVAGLKTALSKGTAQAVSNLGKVDGFFGNDRVRIPLPNELHKVEHTLRNFGMGKYADELELTMNRAAESAVPEARILLLSAVHDMSVQDAKTILTGGDTSATDYFRS
jgi:hypothetical protein